MAAKILMLVVGLVIGGLAGGYAGARQGAGWVLNDAMHQASRDVERMVATLKQVRAGERDAAVERLEAWMDDALILFDPAEPYPGLTPKTIAEMDKALHEAKAYRAAHPRKSSRPHVDAMVGNLLSRQK